MNIFYNRDNYLKDRLNSYITLGNKNELSASKWMFFDKNENEVTAREVYCFPNTSIRKEKNIDDYLIKELSFKN